MNAFKVVKDFEAEIALYTGAPYAVAVNSCTNALFLVLQWFKSVKDLPREIEIPKRTYVGVAHSIRNAGAKVTFRDEDWRGCYRLNPLAVYDAARRFTAGMYGMVEKAKQRPTFVCTSHHWSKILGVQQGGMILHDNGLVDSWLRRARFDGRHEGVRPADDQFTAPGWHCYMSPEVAAEGLVRLSHIKFHNDDLPTDDYPDLSLAPIFGGVRPYSGGPVEDDGA